jgi:ABC-2 type transport system permease protein
VRADLIRTLGFIRKEFVSVIHQPRLLLTLVVAPFLILLIFGLGYRADPPLRTLLVVENEEAQLAIDRQQLDEAFRGAITLVGTSSDEDAARLMLDNGEVDLLIVAPDDPLEVIQSGEQAVFEVVHREIDPVLKSGIRLVARLSVDAINRRVVADVIAAAQEEIETVEDPLRDVRETSALLVAALESGDRSEADRHLSELREQLEAAETGDPRTDDLFASVADNLGTTESDLIPSVEENLDAAESEDVEVAAEAARELESSIGELEESLSAARQLAPELLVNPFRAEVQEIDDVATQPGIFYSPATIVVLLQHLAVTFAALSVVRERQLGLTEVFRASPLGSGEALAGKYLGFGFIGVVVAAALTGAMVSFGIAIRGSLLSYALVIVLLLLGSLGLGFVLSGFSKTDTQAVQSAMIILLLSIFFTGFILPLQQLLPAVRVVSYLVPATYGIQGIHDVVFRGAGIEPMALAGLVLYPIVMAIGAWAVVRRDFDAKLG